MIYLDNAATTRVAPEVVRAMLPYYTEYYGNPSSLYGFSTPCKEALACARGQISKALHAREDEIYFTGGGTESDNWALTAAAEAYAPRGGHLITTQIEHHAILHTARYLEERGYAVTYLPVDGTGLIDPEMVRAAIRPDTFLISVMYANNEIGTLEPVGEIGRLAREHGILFHTDAVQAFGHEPIDVEAEKIDLLSASAHKFHGPKGVGFLYIRRGVKVRSFLHGGAQERARRAGTENVAGIVGMGKAAELAMERLAGNREKETWLRDYLIGRILSEIPYTRLNGHRTRRLSNNANFAFRFVRGDSLLITLDMDGICVSSGSACTSGSPEPSHVLTAIGLPEETAHGALRLTLSEETTKDELDVTIECIRRAVERQRSLSPFFEMK